MEGEPPSKRRGEGGRGGPLPSLHQPLHPWPTVAGPRGRQRASGGMRIFQEGQKNERALTPLAGESDVVCDF